MTVGSTSYLFWVYAIRILFRPVFEFLQTNTYRRIPKLICKITETIKLCKLALLSLDLSFHRVIQRKNREVGIRGLRTFFLIGLLKRNHWNFSKNVSISPVISFPNMFLNTFLVTQPVVVAQPVV